jgi:hypothetical protein
MILYRAYRPGVKGPTRRGGGSTISFLSVITTARYYTRPSLFKCGDSGS